MNENLLNLASKNGLFLVAVVALAVFPFVGPVFVPVYYVLLMTDAMVLAIFALGFDLLFGYVDLISFGHAAYFGLGVFAGALTLIHVSSSVWLMLAAAVLASTAFAALVSALSLRSTGVYFAILTFAFAQILYEIAVRTPEITGGTDGISVPTPTMFGAALDASGLVYYFILAFLVLTYVSAKRIMNSPLGLVFKSIGENNQRAEFIGYDTRRYKQVAFMLSGAYSSIAGALFLLENTYASPETLHWFTSGEVIIMTLFGGMGTLFGPMIGAALYVYLEDLLSTFTGNWPIFIGAIFVIVVIFFPGGIVGTLESSDVIDRLKRLGPARGPDPESDSDTESGE